MGYSLEWIASEIGVKPSRIRKWIELGYLRGAPGSGAREGYSSEFLAASRALYAWLQLYPRGPIENFRDRLYPEEDDE